MGGRLVCSSWCMTSGVPRARHLCFGFCLADSVVEVGVGELGVVDGIAAGEGVACRFSAVHPREVGGSVDAGGCRGDVRIVARPDRLGPTGRISSTICETRCGVRPAALPISSSVYPSPRASTIRPRRSVRAAAAVRRLRRIRARMSREVAAVMRRPVPPSSIRCRQSQAGWRSTRLIAAISSRTRRGNHAPTVVIDPLLSPQASLRRSTTESRS
jgi:hypothetical protein